MLTTIFEVHYELLLLRCHVDEDAKNIMNTLSISGPLNFVIGE